MLHQSQAKIKLRRRQAMKTQMPQVWQQSKRRVKAMLSDAALAGYSAGSTGEPLWRDTRWDPLASRSGGILGGIHWRAALTAYWAGCSDGILDEIYWQATPRWAPLANCSSGILSELLYLATPSNRVGKCFKLCIYLFFIFFIMYIYIYIYVICN